MGKAQGFRNWDPQAAWQPAKPGSCHPTAKTCPRETSPRREAVTHQGGGGAAAHHRLPSAPCWQRPEVQGWILKPQHCLYNNS